MPGKGKHKDKDAEPAAPDKAENQNPDTADAGKASAEKPKPAPAGPARRGNRPVIIVADACAGDVETIKNLAYDEGCDVTAVPQINALMMAMDTANPILVFIEKNIPRLNLSMLCRKAQQRKTAVVLMGQFKSRNELLPIIKLGVVDIMTKPLVPEVVLRKVLQALAYVKTELKRKMELNTPLDGANAEDIAQKVRKALDATREIMVMPHVATRLIALCGQENANVADLAKTATSDAAVSLMLLRRANSAAYGGATRIKSMRDAIVRIGYRTVRSIVTIAAVYKMTGAGHQTPGFNRFGHWTHSLAVGVLAELMATAAKFPAPEDAFLAGVLHDFGKLFFDDYLHDDYVKVFHLASEKNTSIHQMELEYFHMAHETVGWELCRNWRLPEAIGEAIRLHHDDDNIRGDNEDPAHTLARFVTLADRTARAMILGYGGDMYGNPIGDEEWRRTGLHESDLRALTATVIQRVNEMAKWLGIAAGKAGLPDLTPAKDAPIWILDADGAPDHLLDAFAAALGYNTAHGGMTTPPDGTPAFVILDFRGQSPPIETIHDGWKQPAAPVCVIGELTGEITWPATPPVMLSAPLDFLALSQAMAAAE